MKVQFFYGYSILVLGMAVLLVSCEAPNSRSQSFQSSSSPTPSKAWVVGTLAGSGAGGFAGGAGTEAQFYHPHGVAVDSDGNIYVADTHNHRIRKITADGAVSTLAGSGAAGFAEGTGTAAHFHTPIDVAVDSAGNVYVADYHNHRIRKITAGVVTTLAGTGVAGSANGDPLTEAQFNAPVSLTVDSAGNVYVGDATYHRIRKITAVEVTTLAGSTAGFEEGTGTEAQFNQPRGVAVDTDGNVYVADYGNHRIRKITADGEVSTLAGTDTPGHMDATGTAAFFKYPLGVALDSSGNVYVADYYNHRIRKITAAGEVSTIAGTGTKGSANGTSAQFNWPYDVAVDTDGNVYVADKDNHRIRKIEYRVP